MRIFWVFILSLLFSVSIFFMVDNNLKPVEEREFPNDWFFRQRAYPQGVINQPVYLEALKKAKRQRLLMSDKESVWAFRGPTNIEGRITDIALVPGTPQTVFAGAAGGGVFKSDDGGQSWVPVFDDAASLSIGDIAIAPSDPQIIYVGTGEANAGGGSLAYDGVGVFKSEDGGNSWYQTGLETCGSIGRMVVDPQNPDVVYVAAMGGLFSDDGQGGVYKTEDGGQSWSLKLFVSDSTGAIDVVIDPEHPDTLYAAMWERIRRPNRRSYGGATSGIYRSYDGGETWQELTGGLPSLPADKGRIGIDLCASTPEVIYAVYADKVGYFKGIYRSSDHGDSWVKKDNGIDQYAFASYGWWFGRIKVDPGDPDIAYLIAFGLHRTLNGGNQWQEIWDWNVHVDQHALAIDPDNHSILYLGNDGGFYKSVSMGNSWSRNPSLPITQFYTVEVAEQNPQKIFAGAQDNGTVRTVNGSLNNWQEVLGGDGMTVLVDPINNNYAYAEFQYGGLRRSTNGGSSFITAMSGINASDRFNWHAPYTLDPSNPATLYFGTHRLYRSEDHAVSWAPVSGDLTNGDEPGNLAYNTLTTVSVSPLNSNVIYTGSDDGNVYCSVDGALTWVKRSENLPDRWVTCVTADPLMESRVYVTFSGYRWGEYLSHVYRSDDYGGTWQDIASGLPELPVNKLVVDPSDTGYLYLATDAGVYYSENDGLSWAPLSNGMPLLVVTDLRLHNPSRTLYAATYGRGVYSLDLDVLTASKEDVSRDEISVQCFPNPFSENLTIQWKGLQGEGAVFIKNMKGVTVAKLYSGKWSKTDHLIWDGRGYNGQKQPAGTYLVVVLSGQKRIVKSVILK